MNTERLYELLEELTSTAKRIGLVEKLDQLIQHITNQVNEPTNGAHQTAFSEAQAKLKTAIALSWFVRLRMSNISPQLGQVIMSPSMEDRPSSASPGGSFRSSDTRSLMRATTRPVMG